MQVVLVYLRCGQLSILGENDTAYSRQLSAKDSAGREPRGSNRLVSFTSHPPIDQIWDVHQSRCKYLSEIIDFFFFFFPNDVPIELSRINLCQSILFFASRLPARYCRNRIRRVSLLIINFRYEMVEKVIRITSPLCTNNKCFFIIKKMLRNKKKILKTRVFFPNVVVVVVVRRLLVGHLAHAPGRISDDWTACLLLSKFN